MTDPTEAIRRYLADGINMSPGSREALEAEHGQVWDTDQLREEFNVQSFMAPFVVAKRKADGKVGTLMFQHHPRFYFGWQED